MPWLNPFACRERIGDGKTRVDSVQYKKGRFNYPFHFTGGAGRGVPT